MNSLLTWQTIAASVLAVVALILSFRDHRTLAWCWAFLLPVDYVTGIRVEFFDVIRYAGAAWLCLRVKPDLAPGPQLVIRRLATALGALGLLRGLMALVHHDANGTRFATVLLLATAFAYLIAQRTKIHRALASGYVAGLALSTVVALMQAIHWPTLRAGDSTAERYPGLSTYTMLLTWQLAFGVIIATYLLITYRRERGRWWWAGLALAPMFALAMLTNGGQGGMLGLSTALLALLWCQRHHLTPAMVGRGALGLLALFAVVTAVVLVTNIDVPSVTGASHGDFTNETARYRVSIDGLHEFRRHPLTGMSRTEFIQRHTIAPHFLPIDSAAVAGVFALLISVYILGYLVVLVIRGPANRDAATITGYLLVAAMTSNTITDSYGPFVGISRSIPLFLAVVASSGHWISDPRTPSEAIQPPHRSETNRPGQAAPWSSPQT